MNENKKFFSKIGFNYLILAIITPVFSFILASILLSINPRIMLDINMNMIISSIANYILPLPIIIVLMGFLESRTLDKNRITITKFIKYVAITITLMWIGNLIGVFIVQILGLILSNEIINPISEVIENSNILINLIIISIMAPIFEEFLFRKLLIDRTIRYGAKISILVSALMFALFHANLSQFFYAFLLGAFFSYVYINTGNIIYPMMLHGVVNFFGSVGSTIFNDAMTNFGTALNIQNVIYLGTIAVYATFLILSLIIGLYSIFTKYNKIEYNESKREIILEKPMQTAFLNIGMICFILYHVVSIILSFGVI